MSIVRNNMAADQAHRQYTIKNADASKSAKKLSSGYRINNAADDAAGLAISEKMRAQIRGLDQAARNSQDGISLIQTGEGALNEVHSMLHRMGELATQSATGTNEDFDRAALNKEYEQLKYEIDDIAKQTTFNNMRILDGSLEYVDRVASGKISVPMGSVNAAAGVTGSNGSSGVGTVSATAGITSGVSISATPASGDLDVWYSGSATGGRILVAMMAGHSDSYTYASYIDVDPNESTASISQKISDSVTAYSADGIFLNGAGAEEIQSNTVKFTSSYVTADDEIHFDSTVDGVFDIDDAFNCLYTQSQIDPSETRTGNLVQNALSPHFQYELDLTGVFTSGERYNIAVGGMFKQYSLASPSANTLANEFKDVLTPCVDTAGNLVYKNLDIQAVGNKLIISDTAAGEAVSDLLCKDFFISKIDTNFGAAAGDKPGWYSQKYCHFNSTDVGTDSVTPPKAGEAHLNLPVSSGNVSGLSNGSKFKIDGETLVFQMTATPPVTAEAGETLVDMTGQSPTVNNVLAAIEAKLGNESASGNYNILYDSVRARITLKQKTASDISASTMRSLIQVYTTPTVSPVSGSATMTLTETAGQVDNIQNGSSVKVDGKTYVFKMTPAPEVVTESDETLIDMTAVAPQSMSAVINALNAEIGSTSDPGGYDVLYDSAAGMLTLRQPVAADITTERMASLIQFNIDNGFDDDFHGGLTLQVGANQGDTMTIYIPEMTVGCIGIQNTIIDPQDEAEKAITAVKNATTLVSEVRSQFGASQNRLEHKIKNLNNSAENLQSAEASIRDVDMASEMTEYQKQNILSQAATAILAQANAAPQNVLQLLG